MCNSRVKKAVSSLPTKYNRPVGVAEKKILPLINVRYLYQPGELEGGAKRATDPIWSLKVYQVVENRTKPNEPVVYYLSGGPKRGFVREELLVQYLLIRSCPQPEMPVCQGLYAVICYPSLCVKR